MKTDQFKLELMLARATLYLRDWYHVHQENYSSFGISSARFRRMVHRKQGQIYTKRGRFFYLNVHTFRRLPS